MAKKQAGGSAVRIYHNPRCSKSRAALDLIRGEGIEPEIIRYLETPPTAGELKDLLARMGKAPRDVMRKGERVYKELGLGTADVSDAELIKTMVANPVLIERPIVVSEKGVRLGRPPESVLDVLPKGA